MSFSLADWFLPFFEDSVTKAAIEASIASHVSETSPLLKSFAETFLKGLNAFLEECSSRIEKAETDEITLIEMVDLTLDETDMARIKAPKRKRTGLESLRFNKLPREFHVFPLYPIWCPDFGCFVWFQV
jgi:hypothetical protein